MIICLNCNSASSPAVGVTRTRVCVAGLSLSAWWWSLPSAVFHVCGLRCGCSARVFVVSFSREEANGLSPGVEAEE